MTEVIQTCNYTFIQKYFWKKQGYKGGCFPSQRIFGYQITTRLKDQVLQVNIANMTVT